MLLNMCMCFCIQFYRSTSILRRCRLMISIVNFPPKSISCKARKSVKQRNKMDLETINIHINEIRKHSMLTRFFFSSQEQDLWGFLYSLILLEQFPQQKFLEQPPQILASKFIQTFQQTTTLEGRIAACNNSNITSSKNLST